jgi:molecular chaperone DnaK (HSP70)
LAGTRVSHFDDIKALAAESMWACIIAFLVGEFKSVYRASAQRHTFTRPFLALIAFPLFLVFHVRHQKHTLNFFSLTHVHTTTAIAAVLAASGFKGRVTIVGIDLGTTYSVIAVNEGGAVHVITDDDGSPLVPSMVSFLQGGGIAVGRAAQALVDDPSAVTVYEAKRIIGRVFADEAELAKEGAGRPFSIVPAPQSAAGDTSAAWFDLSAVVGHEPAVSPQAVGSHIITELQRMAAQYLGHTQVRSAVIAVPAKFTAQQRQATAQAFRQAGLAVARVLEEPTAAALAYGLQSRPDVHYVLVYDFGGGTLDVSLLYISEGSVQVIASDGDDRLGGGDFDRAVTALLVQKLGKTAVMPNAAVTAESAAAAAECGCDAPLCTPHALRAVAEHAKRELSFADSVTAQCCYNTAAVTTAAGATAATTAADSCVGWQRAEVTVQRSEFEAACSDLFKRAVASVDRLLEGSGLEASDVDEAVLVGGTSRVPRVRSDLKQRLGLDKLNTHIDPDVTVAYGAATVAH